MTYKSSDPILAAQDELTDAKRWSRTVKIRYAFWSLLMPGSVIVGDALSITALSLGADPDKVIGILSVLFLVLGTIFGGLGSIYFWTEGPGEDLCHDARRNPPAQGIRDATRKLRDVRLAEDRKHREELASYEKSMQESADKIVRNWKTPEPQDK